MRAAGKLRMSVRVWVRYALSSWSTPPRSRSHRLWPAMTSACVGQVCVEKCGGQACVQ